MYWLLIRKIHVKKKQIHPFCQVENLQYSWFEEDPFMRRRKLYIHFSNYMTNDIENMDLLQVQNTPAPYVPCGIKKHQ